MSKTEYGRLTLAERIIIQDSLKQGISLKNIAKAIRRGTSTVSREIRRNSAFDTTDSYGAKFNNCVHRDTCSEYMLCGDSTCTRNCCCGCRDCFANCTKYVRETCSKLEEPPYVCNGCKKRNSCSLQRSFYKAKKANHSAVKIWSDARAGIDIDVDELKRIDGIISPLVRQGHSLYNILETHKGEIMLSDKTIYNYVDKGLLGVKNMDLFQKTHRKLRKKHKPCKVDRKCREGRTFADFNLYIAERDSAYVEIDSVIGTKGGAQKVLLTMQFPMSMLMLAFVRDANTANSVRDIINDLDATLGRETFEKVFSVLLADNGPEFSDPSSIEADSDGVARTKVFYCDPQASYQKPHVENNHGFIRRFLPKGESMNELTQDKVNLMMSHINSYRRKALGGHSPAEIFVNTFGQEVYESLGLKIIQPDDIILSPSVIK